MRVAVVLTWQCLACVASWRAYTPSLDLQEEGASPMAHAHFNAEGDVEFRAILYVPDKAPYDFYDNYYQRKSPVRLYVRRVFISDSFDELLPRYLSFLLGLVDSDTLPLNVSREMLQQHSSLKTIKKKLVRPDRCHCMCVAAKDRPGGSGSFGRLRTLIRNHLRCRCAECRVCAYCGHMASDALPLPGLK